MKKPVNTKKSIIKIIQISVIPAHQNGNDYYNPRLIALTDTGSIYELLYEVTKGVILDTQRILKSAQLVK